MTEAGVRQGTTTTTTTTTIEAPLDAGTDAPPESERARVSGAGVLCCAMPPGSGDVYLLLGKEREDPEWKFASNRWADFGGGTHEGETPEETAAREFVEESLAVVPTYDGERIPIPSSARLAKRLAEGQYAFKVTLCMRPYRLARRNPAPGGPSPTVQRSRCHVCFVKQIPWMPDVVERFDHARDKLDALARAIKEYRVARSRIDPGWPFLFPGDDLVGTDRRVVEVVSVASDPVDGGPAPVSIHVRAASSSCEQARCTEVPIRTAVESDRAPEVPLYSQALLAWRRVASTYDDLPIPLRRHPAVTTARCCGHLVDVKVNEDYLEKKKIRWWGLPRLEEVVRNGGCYRGEFFRSSFLPFLSVVLDKFGRLMPPRVPALPRGTLLSPANRLAPQQRNGWVRHRRDPDRSQESCAEDPDDPIRAFACDDSGHRKRAALARAVSAPVVLVEPTVGG